MFALCSRRDWFLTLLGHDCCRNSILTLPLHLVATSSQAATHRTHTPHQSHCPNPLFLCQLHKPPSVMSDATSPNADIRLPAPRLSSLVYRGSRSNSQSDQDRRPRPTAQDKVVERHFATLNGVEDDQCWLTRQAPAERAHVVPHAESDCTRLVSR